MKHIRKFESYQKKIRRDEIIKESVLQVNDIYKVRSLVDIPQSLINAYVKKVKDTTGKNLRQFFGDVDIAEEILKWVTLNNVDVDKIPAGALTGDAQGQAQPGQAQPGQAQAGQAQAGQAQAGQAQAQPGQAQSQPGQAQPEQEAPQAQAQQGQVQVQTEAQPQAQAQQGQVQVQTEAQPQGQGEFEEVGEEEGEEEKEEEGEEEGEEELPL